MLLGDGLINYPFTWHPARVDLDIFNLYEIDDGPYDTQKAAGGDDVNFDWEREDRAARTAI